MLNHLTDFFSPTPGPQCSDEANHGKTLCTVCRWAGSENDVVPVFLDDALEEVENPDDGFAYVSDQCPKCGSASLLDACCC